MSQWQEVLREACNLRGQSQIGREIKYSPSTISQILKGTYKGSTAQVEKAVRGALMGQTLCCPVMGELALDRCLENQKMPYAATNSIRVKLYRACQTCPHNKSR